MARTKERDALLKSFMARNRRKPRGVTDQGFPSRPKVPGGTLTFAKASQTPDTNLYRSNAPGPPAKVPRGFQHWMNERHSMPAGQQVLHDGTPTPAGTGPFRRPRKGRTRPTPGSAYRRRKPTYN